MLAIVAHVPDALAVSLDEEHVGVIDAVAVKERCYLDVANADAFWILAWRSTLPYLNLVEQLTFVISRYEPIQSVAILLRITFVFKEFKSAPS